VRELEAAEAAIRALQQIELAGSQPQTVLDIAQQLFVLGDQLDAALQRVMEHIHWTSATYDAAKLGPINWMRQHCRRSGGEAQTRAKLARHIADHPASATAHADGKINLAQLNIIIRTLANLPEADRDTAEQILLRAAEHVDPKDLERLARELEAAIDPDAEDKRAARRYRSRYLTAATTFAGMVHINGVLDPENGAALLAALAPLMAPQGEDDPRSAGQRRADALGQLARDALARESLPDINGAKPLIQVTISWDDLREQLGLGSIGSPGHDLPLDAGTIRRMACDANILPVILGGPSDVLDIGRISRTWPLAIRRAAALRDSGCTFPGCRAPIAFCELHHIRHWVRDLGPSSLFNSAHLCVRHHHLVHNKNWTVTRHPDNTLTFTDPDTGKTSTWQPAVTLTDFLSDPASTPDTAARPEPFSASPRDINPRRPGPDIACQTPGRQVLKIRIRPRHPDGGNDPGSAASPAMPGEDAITARTEFAMEGTGAAGIHAWGGSASTIGRQGWRTSLARGRFAARPQAQANPGRLMGRQRSRCRAPPVRSPHPQRVDKGLHVSRDSQKDGQQPGDSQPMHGRLLLVTGLLM
jgi:hypothetical protein